MGILAQAIVVTFYLTLFGTSHFGAEIKRVRQNTVQDFMQKTAMTMSNSNEVVIIHNFRKLQVAIYNSN